MIDWRPMASRTDTARGLEKRVGEDHLLQVIRDFGNADLGGADCSAESIAIYPGASKPNSPTHFTIANG